jgi:hypothetical protein
MSRRRCRACGERWAQHPRALCRRCDRAAGTWQPRDAAGRRYLTAAQDAALRHLLAAVARERERLAALRPVVVTGRERVVEHRTYVVVWDGTRE